MSQTILEPPKAQPQPKPPKSEAKSIEGLQKPAASSPDVQPAPAHPLPPRKAVSAWLQAKSTDSGALTVMGGMVVAVLVLIALILGLGANGTVVRQVPASQSGMTGMTGTTSHAAPANMPAHKTYDAQAPATPTGDVVSIKLVAKEATIAIAPNIAYNAWTFDGTVPGPIIRVRQGQTIHFTLQNDSNMPHSIDFHAAQTPWNVNYQAVAPGKSFSFDWKANYPGVFMYHCGTPPVMFHMANGMYGAIIVDPAYGWAPAQEYVLVQSEFYTKQNADGTYSLDANKMMQVMPDYVTFNGYANQYKDASLTAKAGQKIRLFIVNAGPSQFSAFHVIGAIFSDVYADGNPANHTVGDQTITIPPGGGSVVELTIPDAGSYPFVTHSFSAASTGATGVLSVKP